MSLFNLFKKKNKIDIPTTFIKKIKNAISQNELEKIEKDYKIRFPEILRSYWLTYGDSAIKRCCFIGRDFQTDLSAICSPMESMEVIKLGKENNWLPDNFYPIAHDSGGNYYCWNSEDNKVYLLFDDDIDNPFVFCDSVEELFNLMNNCKFEN